MTQFTVSIQAPDGTGRIEHECQDWRSAFNRVSDELGNRVVAGDLTYEAAKRVQGFFEEELAGVEKGNCSAQSVFPHKGFIRDPECMDIQVIFQM